jgi:hypothetical protein
MPIWSPAMIFGSAASGYVIEGSGSFNGSDGKLTRTISDAGNRRTFILEVAYKRGGTASSYLTAYSSGTDTFYWYLSSDQVYLQNYVSGTQMELKSDAKLRDFSAWYHLIAAIDTTQSTDTNRVKAWLNGVELTWASSPRTYPAEDLELKWNTGSQEHQIGHSSTTYSPDYFARAAAYDGLTMTDPATDAFGEFDDNGVWVPLNVSGKTFGTTGFLIEGGAAFTNGTDSSGNSQNFTKGGTITDVDDTLTDKASSDFGNYATINPLDAGSPTQTPTFSNGLTTFTRNGTASNNQQAYATQVAVGKKYWEFDVTGNNNSIEVGWAAPGEINGNEGSGAGGWDVEVYVLNVNAAGGGGPWYIFMQEGTAGSATNTQTSIDSSEVTTTPRLKFAIDTDNKKYWLGVVDSSYGGWFNTSGVGGQTFDESAPTGTYTSDERFVPYVFGHAQTAAGTFYFRDADWSDSAPSGFTAMSTANLPAPTVTDPSKYFQTVIYTGDTNNNRNITGFQDAAGNNVTPDFIWLKGRSNATNHYMQDVARGFGASKDIQSQDNEEQGSLGTSNGYIGGVVAGGFTAVDGSANDAYVNENGRTYVAWMWKAGGSASSNSNGSITSSVSVADHGGFSIMTYTGNGSAGATIGHGLGRAANFQIFKRYDAHQDWHVGTNATGSIIGAELNNNTGSVTAAVTAFNATTTAVAASGVTNDSSAEYVSYAFARTPGAIGVGSYTANGSTDGPTVVIDDGASGFKPAFLLIKNVSRDARYWVMLDNVRNTFNPVQNALIASEVLAEATGYLVDFLAAGFKIRAGDSTQLNTGTDTHVYLAFAENPFGGDGVAQAKAR